MSGLDQFNGLREGDVCLIKGDTPFKGLRCTILKIYTAQFINMKAPKIYAQVVFQAGNSRDFQITKLAKENN